MIISAATNFAFFSLRFGKLIFAYLVFVLFRNSRFKCAKIAKTMRKKYLSEMTMNLNVICVTACRVYKIVNQGGHVQNFHEISAAEHLESDEHILVLPKNDRKLQVKVYPLEGKNNFKVTTSPRAGQYYLYPSFPGDPNFYKHNRSLNK